MNVKHSKATPRWGTPPAIIDRARIALDGRIELDPMSESCFAATVGAVRYWTEVADCFSQPTWECETMLINPAGGLVVPAWQRLVSEFMAGRVGAAIWIGYTSGQLNVLADEQYHPDDFSKLTCRKRIPFVHHDKASGAAPDLVDRPAHGNYIVGLGIDPWKFELAFAGLGRFHHGWLAGARIRKEAA